MMMDVDVSLGGVDECPFAPSSPADRRSNPDKLTVASWNAEWLFLYGIGSTNCPGSGCAWKNASEAQEHFDAAVSVISRLDADVLVLLEVNDCEILRLLLDTPSLSNAGYKPYLRAGTDTYTNQNVGILTRIDPYEDVSRSSAKHKYPVEGTHCGAYEYGSYGCSKHAFAKFNVKGLSKDVLLVGAHLLAHPDDKVRCLKREAQACVIRDIVAQHGSNSEVIVMGDMNDFSSTVPDAQDSKPISRVLEILSNAQEDVCSSSHGGGATTNYPEFHQLAASVKEQSQRYSAWWDRNRNCKVYSDELSMIDHMLLSEGLARRASIATIEHMWDASCGVQSDH